MLPYTDVLRLHVTVDIALVVHELEAVDHLNADHQTCLDCKLLVAEVKQLFQIRAQHGHHHTVVVVLNAIPVNLAKARPIFQVPVDFGLILELRL